jgi:sensor histidine kinase regulating citrate/malate metabolism
MSARAKIQAEEIALIPTLRNEVEQKDIKQSMTLCKNSRHSDASFIVIGDNKGQHLFHSVFADRVGQRWSAAITKKCCREKHHHHSQRRAGHFAAQQSAHL